MLAKVKKTITSRSLMVTLAVYFFVFSLTVLLIEGGLQIYFNFQTQQRLVAEQQHLIAEDAANIVKSFIQEKFSTMETATSVGNLATKNQKEQKLVLEKLLGIESAFRQLALFNKQEEELVRVSRVSDSVSGQLVEKSRNEIFSHLNQEETYVSSVYILEETSEPQVILAVQIKDIFGNSQGTMVAEVNLKCMWDLVGRLKVGKTGTAYVIDRQGNLIAFGDISRVLKGENLIHLKEVARVVNYIGPETEIKAEISEGILGTQVMATHAYLGMPDWAVVVELPVAEAYETVIEGIMLSVWMIILIIVLAVVVGVYISKKISKPIKKLTRNIEDISMGKLDTEIDPKLKQSKNEIGDLARAFDRTMVSLKLAMRQKNNEKGDKE